MENLTVSKDTTSWLMVEFNDAAWVKPAIPPIVLDDPVPLLSESATSALAQLTLSASGHLWERYTLQFLLFFYILRIAFVGMAMPTTILLHDLRCVFSKTP